jgi:hypothetical protein
VDDKHVQPKEEQVTSTMLSYQSIERMLQSIGRKEDQQWRIGHCSQQLEESSQKFFVTGARVCRASVSHPYGGFEISRPGARQFLDMYNSTQDIRVRNGDSNPQNFKSHHKHHNTNSHNSNHEKGQKNDDEACQ